MLNHHHLICFHEPNGILVTLISVEFLLIFCWMHPVRTWTTSNLSFITARCRAFLQFTLTSWIHSARMVLRVEANISEYFSHAWNHFLTIILNNMYSITNIKFNKLQNWTLWQFNEKTKQGAWHMFFDGCIIYLLRINHLFSCNRSDTCCIKPSKTSSIGA